MEKKCAFNIQQHLLQAVEKLTSAFLIAQENCSDEEVQQFRRSIGSAIGRIQVEILDPIYIQHPELDDLKEKSTQDSLLIKKNN